MKSLFETLIQEAFSETHRAIERQEKESEEINSKYDDIKTLVIAMDKKIDELNEKIKILEDSIGRKNNSQSFYDIYKNGEE